MRPPVRSRPPAPACRLLLAAALLGLGAPGGARAGAGVAGADILKLPTEARGWGLGGAYSAIGDDVGAIAYNPAGLAQSAEREARFTTLVLPEGASTQGLQLSWPLGHWGTLGGMYLYRGVPTIDNGPNVLDQTVGGLTAYDSVWGAYTAVRFSHLIPSVRWMAPFSAGVGLKSVSSHIGGFAANATAADLGVLALLDKVRLAMAFQNVGGGLRFPGTVEDETDPLPTTMRLGAALVVYEDARSSFTAAIENATFVSVNTSQKISGSLKSAAESLSMLSFAVEYWRLKKMGVRLGYVDPWGQGGDSYSGTRGLALGATFRLFSRTLAYQFDLAWHPINVGSERQDDFSFSVSVRL